MFQTTEYKEKIYVILNYGKHDEGWCKTGFNINTIV